jgi:hypothetical protein
MTMNLRISDVVSESIHTYRLQSAADVVVPGGTSGSHHMHLILQYGMVSAH